MTDTSRNTAEWLGFDLATSADETIVSRICRRGDGSTYLDSIFYGHDAKVVAALLARAETAEAGWSRAMDAADAALDGREDARAERDALRAEVERARDAALVEAARVFANAAFYAGQVEKGWVRSAIDQIAALRTQHSGTKPDENARGE